VSYNKAVIADQLLNQALIKLQYRLGLHQDNNPLDNSIQTQYRVRIKSSGEKLTLYEPSAIMLSLQKDLEILSVNGEQYKDMNQLPSIDEAQL